MTDDHLPHLHCDAASTTATVAHGELQETSEHSFAPVRSVAARGGLDLAPAVGILRRYCLEKDIPCVVVTEQTGRVDQQDIVIATTGLPSA